MIKYNNQLIWPFQVIFFFILFFLVIGCSSQPEPSPIAVEVPTQTSTLLPSPNPQSTATNIPNTPLVPSTVSTATLIPRVTDTLQPSATNTPLPTNTSTVTVIPTATPTLVPAWHEVDEGDTLFEIAMEHDTSVEVILQMNGIEEDSRLRVGRVLAVPSDITISLPECHLIEDSEVINTSTYVTWDTDAFLKQQGGYLASYEESGRTAGEIIERVADRYHVGPRALLAMIELKSGWVTKKNPSEASPFGMKSAGTADLSWWLSWAAQKMMQSYYGQLEGRRDWVAMGSGAQARLYPGTNAGSAAIVSVLAAVSVDPDELSSLLDNKAFEKTYDRLFGQIEGAGPVVPADGKQPYLELPWYEGEQWVFTGGPHGGYGDHVTGWAALDFAPPIPRGCWPSEFPVLAVAPGLVVDSSEGQVWVELDKDNDFRTGWAIYYLHLATEGRIEAGVEVEVGDIIGYPSCEGGIANASHLHIARMYEGQWMPANGPVPFQLGNWNAEALVGSSYDGRMINITGRVLEARPARIDGFNVFPRNGYDRIKRTSGR